MEKVTYRRIEEVLQGNWNNFQNTIKGYMLHTETSKGIKQLWEHFQIHLCLWEEKGEWDQGQQNSPFLIINENTMTVIQESEDKEQIIKAAQDKAAESRKKEYPVESICVEIPELVSFSDYRDIMDEHVEGSEKKYNAVWIGTYRKTASEQEKTAAGVILNFLKICSDNLHIIIKASEEQWTRYGEKEGFDYIQYYKEYIFSKYSFLKEQIISGIAAARYETRENNAVIYFVNENDLNELLGNKSSGLACFAEDCYPEYSMYGDNSISSTRKMLEVCSQSDRYLLVSDCAPYYLRGFVTVSKFGGKADKNFSISFMGRGEWKISKGKETFLIYHNMLFYTDDSMNDADMDMKIGKMSRIDQGNKNRFKRIFQQMEGQQHGALMIVSADAKDETGRLCSKFQRGMQINEISLENENNLDLLAGMASIDGAVMVDLNGNCYGFGIILDGKAKIRGDTGRGARFNSSVNYIAGSERYAVIVSEDRERGIEIIDGLKQEIIAYP